MKKDASALQALQDRIARLARVKLAELPTPLVKLESFSSYLGGPQILHEAR